MGYVAILFSSSFFVFLVGGGGGGWGGVVDWKQFLLVGWKELTSPLLVLYWEPGDM